jgi:hypothetical protein
MREMTFSGAPLGDRRRIGGVMNMGVSGRGVILAICILLYCTVPGEPASTRICTGQQETLDCLRENFEQLYKSEYERFFEILRVAEKTATKCDSVLKTVDFLDVARAIGNNAEVAEYFSQVVEIMCTTSSECLLEGLLGVSEESRVTIISGLRAPTFLEKETIRAVFVRYRNNPRYKTLMGRYFAPK